MWWYIFIWRLHGFQHLQVHVFSSILIESSVEIPLQSYIVNFWWIYDTLILFQETCMGEFAYSNGELRGRVKAKCIM